MYTHGETVLCCIPQLCAQPIEYDYYSHPFILLWLDISKRLVQSISIKPKH